MEVGSEPRRRRKSARVVRKDHASDRASRVFAPAEVRYILIEIIIVATGVFIALVVDELRQTMERRSLLTQTRAELRAEALLNRSRMARKLYLLRAAAQTLQVQPYRATELVGARRNDISRPFSTAWAMANQTDALRFLEPEERRRITDSYSAQAVYVELTTEEMTAWTRLAGTASRDATPMEARERQRAIQIWRAYAGRVGLAACIAAARIEAQLNPNLPAGAGARVCPMYRLDGDPGAIYRGLKTTVPWLRPIAA